MQQHKHSTYCKRSGKCRFNFPHPPTTRTLIATEGESEEAIKAATDTLKKVKKVLTETQDLTLDALLRKAEVSHSDYEMALNTTSKGSKIVIRRDPCDCNINNYNPSILLAWQANMDIQYVMDAYACVMYVASYMMKHEKSMSELLRTVANEVRTQEINKQLRKVGTTFLTHREVSAQEAVYRLLCMPMKRLSRSVVFVDTNPKNKRIHVLKSSKALEELDDDSKEVFLTTLNDRYRHRPQHLQSMCLAEFAATYTTVYQRAGDDEGAEKMIPLMMRAQMTK